MIELIASGPVHLANDTRVDRKDGHDRIRGRVTVSRELEVDLDLEFEQGHVNLEGYAPSYVDWPLKEILGPYIRGALDAPDREIEIPGDEWDVDLRGEWWDWVQQAHRYQTERPERSLLDCLTLFSRWDEVDNRSIERAKGKLDPARVANSDVPLRDMDADDVSWMEGDLRGLNEYLEGTIKDSYA